MRPRFFVALVCLLGTGLVGISFLSKRLIEDQNRPPVDPRLSSEAAPLPAPANGPQPIAAIDKTEHSFGEMAQHEIGRHNFTIRNEGEFPLLLTKGETSCKCTMSDLAQDQIPPGGEGQIQLEWKTLYHQGEFRQTADILTNDPKRPVIHLAIVGTIRVPLRVVPKELVFTNLVASEGGSAQVQIFVNSTDDLKLSPATFLNSDSAASLDVSLVQIAAKDLPADAKCGWTVKVTVKPGLPYGRIQQTIRLETNLLDVKYVEIPVQAAVQSYFSVIGRDWNGDRGVLKLGVIPSREGAARNLKLLIRGPKRKELRLLAPVADPNLIEVTVGEPAEISDGSLVQVPLTVRIPPGSPAMNHLGSDRLGRMGEIKIETSEPDYGPLWLKVQFAIED